MKTAKPFEGVESVDTSGNEPERIIRFDFSKVTGIIKGPVRLSLEGDGINSPAILRVHVRAGNFPIISVQASEMLDQIDDEMANAISASIAEQFIRRLFMAAV